MSSVVYISLSMKILKIICNFNTPNIKPELCRYPEVTPKHEEGEAVEGQLGFQAQASKAAEHLYSIIDGKPKEVLGTTYAHIKQIVTTVHECGYFDKSAAPEPEPQPEPEPPSEEPAPDRKSVV